MLQPSYPLTITTSAQRHRHRDPFYAYTLRSSMLSESDAAAHRLSPCTSLRRACVVEPRKGFVAGVSGKRATSTRSISAICRQIGLYTPRGAERTCGYPAVPAGLDPTPDSNAQERAEGPRRKGPHHRGARPSTPPYGSLPLRNVDAPLNSFQLSNVHDVAPRSQSAGRAFHVEGMWQGPGGRVQYLMVTILFLNCSFWCRFRQKQTPFSHETGKETTKGKKTSENYTKRNYVFQYSGVPSAM